MLLVYYVYFAQYCNSVVVEVCAVEGSVHLAYNSFPLKITVIASINYALIITCAMFCACCKIMFEWNFNFVVMEERQLRISEMNGANSNYQRLAEILNGKMLILKQEEEKYSALKLKDEELQHSITEEELKLKEVMQILQFFRCIYTAAKINSWPHLDFLSAHHPFFSLSNHDN